MHMTLSGKVPYTEISHHWKAAHDVVVEPTSPTVKCTLKTLSDLERSEIGEVLSVSFLDVAKDMNVSALHHMEDPVTGKSTLYRSGVTEEKHQLRTRASYVAVETCPGLFARAKRFERVTVKGSTVVLARLQLYPMAHKQSIFWHTKVVFVKEQLFPMDVLSLPLIVSIEKEDICFLNVEQTILVPPTTRMNPVN